MTINLLNITERLNQIKVYNQEIHNSRLWSLADSILDLIGLSFCYNNQTISLLEESCRQLAATSIQRNWRIVRPQFRKIRQAAEVLKKGIHFTHSVMIIQRFWRRRRMTRLKRKEDRFLKETSVFFTHGDLTHLYKPTGKELGSGCHGNVREGIDQSNGNVVAAKIGRTVSYLAHYKRLPDYRAKVFARIDTALEATPHLTRIYSLHKARSSRTLTPNQFYPFVNNLFWEETYYYSKMRIVTVMERLEGDMSQKHIRLKEPALLFQLIYTRWTLMTNYGLSLSDAFKSANILYKELTPEDTFQGKKMIEYDYWRYSMQGHQYYIPRQEILLKFGDYDCWDISDESPSKPFKHHSDHLQTSLDLASYYVEEGITAKTIGNLFQKPDDPKARILIINE